MVEPIVRVAATNELDPERAARDLTRQLGDAPASIVWFFASSRHDFEALAAHVHQAAGAARTVGCTTCGEIGPAGWTVGGACALALSDRCRAAAVLVDALARFRFESAERVLGELTGQLALSAGELAREPDAHVLVTLTDGLSGQEEILIAALATYAPGVALVGGSAADDFHFVETQVAVDGRAAAGAAAVVLLQPRVPFHPFHLHHYERTEESVVVTEADPVHRLIGRLDGRPAIERVARLLELPPDELRREPLVLLRDRPVVFGIRAAGHVFLRSVMSLRGDALLMGGAVEEGTVLWPMTPGDIVRVTSQGIDEALGQLARPAGMLLFNCGGRLWEATSQQLVGELSKVMQPVPAAGFTTYGEQYGPLQVNHTLTGLAFGGGDVG